MKKLLSIDVGIKNLAFCLFVKENKDSDIYHLCKHIRKFSPGRISDDEFEKMRPWYIKLHRLIATPVRRKRRNYLRRVEKNAAHHPEGAERH